MKKEEKINGQINITITPANLFVNFWVFDAGGKLLNDFNLSPFDALSVANSLTDASLISRVYGMIIEAQQKESEARAAKSTP